MSAESVLLRNPCVRHTLLIRISHFSVNARFSFQIGKLAENSTCFLMVVFLSDGDLEVARVKVVY